MKTIEECKARSLDEYFSELVPKLRFQRTPVYRGQASINWSLLPGLLREDLARAEFGNWASLDAVQISKFKKRSAGLLACQPHSELEWRAQGAQQGLPTALSSWSENGMVALYFATELSDDESDGVVWRLLPGDSGMEISQDHEQVPGKPGIYFPRYRDEAMENQRVCFLTHALPEGGGTPMAFEDYYPSSREELQLCRIRIPHVEKESIRSSLATIGMDARSLFPDLRGLCTQIREEMYTHTNSYNWIVETL